jgi:hypothetical protein
MSEYSLHQDIAKAEEMGDLLNPQRQAEQRAQGDSLSSDEAFNSWMHIRHHARYKRAAKRARAERKRQTPKAKRRAWRHVLELGTEDELYREWDAWYHDYNVQDRHYDRVPPSYEEERLAWEIHQEEAALRQRESDWRKAVQGTKHGIEELKAFLRTMAQETIRKAEEAARKAEEDRNREAFRAERQARQRAQEEAEYEAWKRAQDHATARGDDVHREVEPSQARLKPRVNKFGLRKSSRTLWSVSNGCHRHRNRAGTSHSGLSFSATV